MTPNELYQREPVKTDFDVSVLFGCYFNHMPEVWHETYWQTIEGNNRIQIRYYKDDYYDTRRIWRLASVWFDNKPFMIIRNAGREGDDHASRFVTDEEVYKEAAVYLQSILTPEFREVKDVVDPATDIANLTTFYSDSL